MKKDVPMKPVLLTGFEPFGGDAINASWETVQLLDGALCHDHPICVRQMPCVFGRATIALEQAILEIEPQLVLCVGQSSTLGALALERVALNLDDARAPDNAGQQPVDQPVVPDGPVAYFSSLPTREIVTALHHAGIPASLSQSAGTYVCNHLFYGACHLRATRYPAVRQVGFLHVPLLPEQAVHRPGAASMERGLVVRALLIAVELSLRAGLSCA